mgnify:CR=1 FL=1
MESLGPFKVTTTAVLTISCVGEAKTMLVTFVGKNIQDQTTLNIEIKIAFITLEGEAIAKLATSITPKQHRPTRCLLEESK